MALKIADRVKEGTSTTGTGTWNLDGSVNGFQTFVEGIGSGDTCPYFAVNLTDPTEWETGIGTVTDATPDTLARSVLTSSNGNNLVNFTNTPTVACGWIADITTLLALLGAITATSTDTLTNKTLDDDSNNVHAIVTDVRVRNVSGSLITAGQVVHITGYNSGQDRLTIDLADADDAAKMPAIGLAEHDIANNANGHIVKAGLTDNIDTSAFAVGDEIYVSTTAGTLTATKPTGATAAIQKIGLVVRSHASLGRVMVVGSGRENDIPNSLGAHTQTGNVTVDGGITYDGRDLSVDGTKLDYLTVTQAVDLDAIEIRVNALDASVILMGTWDASVGTFPGGGTAQAGESWIVSVGGTIDSQVFVANDRIVAILDNASTSTYASNWHKLDYTDQVLSVNSQIGAVVLDADDISDGATTNKFVTAGDITKLGNLSGTNTGDEVPATTSVEGIVEKSTSAENKAGTATNKYPDVAGVREIAGIAKQNSQSVDYTLVLTDAGKSLYHSSGAGADTFMIPANSSVAFTIGTMVTFVNDSGSGVLTIAITTDTLRMSPDGETGSRTLAVDGIATAIKVTATKWMISGSGLT